MQAFCVFSRYLSQIPMICPRSRSIDGQVSGIQGCLENVLIKSLKISPHLISLYTAKILPRLSANFNCVPIVHCKPPGTIACITNILSLPRRLVSWYDQHFFTVSKPNNFHGITSKDLCFYQDLFLTFKLEKSCFCQEFLLYISMIPSCSR